MLRERFCISGFRINLESTFQITVNRCSVKGKSNSILLRCGWFHIPKELFFFFFKQINGCMEEKGWCFEDGVLLIIL